MTKQLDNTQDVIDSRDVIARIDELRDEIASSEGDEFDGSKVGGPDDPVDAELRDELAALEALEALAEGYSEDWRHDAALIRESYFAEYCRELVRDIDGLPRDLPDYIEIDWEKTADNLRVDYSEVDYGGVAYLIR